MLISISYVINNHIVIRIKIYGVNQQKKNQKNPKKILNFKNPKKTQNFKKFDFEDVADGIYCDNWFYEIYVLEPKEQHKNLH